MPTKIITNLERVKTAIDGDIAVLNTIQDVDPLDRLKAAAQQVVDSGVYKGVYKSNLEDALEKNPEFSSSNFSGPLRSIIYDPDILEFDVVTQQFHLRMREVAGDLSIWAEAINAAREDIENKGTNPQRASMFWQAMYKVAREGKPFKRLDEKRTTYYRETYQEPLIRLRDEILTIRNTRNIKKATRERNAAKKEEEYNRLNIQRRNYIQKTKATDLSEQLALKYIEIMQTRFGQVPVGLAPWWYIVNYGLAVTETMNVGRGGKPYPINIPTNFVEKTENYLTDAYRAVLEEQSQPQETEIVDTPKMKSDVSVSLTGGVPRGGSYLTEKWKEVWQSKKSGQYVSPGTKGATKMIVRARNQYT